MEKNAEDISEKQKIELDKRIEDYKNNPNMGIEWDLVKKEIIDKIDIKE